MTVLASLPEARERQLREDIQALANYEAACQHPAGLLRHVTMPDERGVAGYGLDAEGQEMVGSFQFDFDGAPFAWQEGTRDWEWQNVTSWSWQKEILDWWLKEPVTIVLKARQIGATWLAAGFGLWLNLYRRGSVVLIYRQKEDDAGKIVERIWDMYQSLPKYLRNDARVITPTRNVRPSTQIEWQFPNGKVSKCIGMASTSSAGHGDVAAFAILDEFSRIERAAEIMKACGPAVGKGGKLIIISTANGVSDPESGEGNYFHYLWENHEEARIARRFLSWRLHPDRDQAWYDTDPEVRRLRAHERAEQFPATPEEAFTLTNRVYFDADALTDYSTKGVEEPIMRLRFEEKSTGQAKIVEEELGQIRVYRRPEEEHEYAIGADVATGRGMDYSAAYVIDLSSMELVAEFHGKVDADLYAAQLHYLGRWYNSARIAVETGGGYGEAPIVFLRDGNAGRPPYPKMYRHVLSSRPDLPHSKPFGFPMNQKTRPLVLENMEQAIRERSLPYMTSGLLGECKTFVRHDTGRPEIRAQQGCRDDRVLACAIALEMFRLYGQHPKRKKHKLEAQRIYKPLGKTAPAYS